MTEQTGQKEWIFRDEMTAEQIKHYETKPENYDMDFVVTTREEFETICANGDVVTVDLEELGGKLVCMRKIAWPDFDRKRKEWKRTSERIFWYFLEVLPPRRHSGSAHMCMEGSDSHGIVCKKEGGLFYERMMTLAEYDAEFNPHSKQSGEIKSAQELGERLAGERLYYPAEDLVLRQIAEEIAKITDKVSLVADVNNMSLIGLVSVGTVKTEPEYLQFPFTLAEFHAKVEQIKRVVDFPLTMNPLFQE